MLAHLHKYLPLYLLAVAVANVALFGVPHNEVWRGGTLGSDALGYAQYAENLASGNGYSQDGEGFDAIREPGYPAFLAAVYLLFGIGNVWAVLAAQTLLLAATGYLAYIIARRFSSGYAPVIAGIAVNALPYYGYYAGEVMTELPFAFLLFLCLYASIRFYERPGALSSQALAGLAFALAALTRAQMLLFPFLFGLVFLAANRRRLRGALLPLAVAALFYLAPVLAWSGVVYGNTGHFELTQGRQEMLIHVRAIRASLSYADQIEYARQWLLRSASGGEKSLSLLRYDLKPVEEAYFDRAASREAVKQILEEDVQDIRKNFGQYLFGNLVETMKFLYVEHDYSNYLNKYFRSGVYALMYALFAFGLWRLARGWGKAGREFKIAAGSALLLIGYHILLLTFLETVPRFNTPLHGLYVFVGIAGAWLWHVRRASAV